MELRSGRFVDIPIISSDFDLFARAEDIGEFDGFTARDVVPHADPRLAVKIHDKQYFGFNSQQGDIDSTSDTASEFDPAELSDSDSSDSWDESVRVPVKRKAIGAETAVDDGKLGASFTFRTSAQLSVEVPRLSEHSRSLYRPASVSAPAASNGRVVALGHGRVIRMAPERVTRFAQRRVLRTAREREAKQIEAAQTDDVPRPAKVPRLQLHTSQPKKKATAHASQSLKPNAVDRKLTDSASSIAAPKAKTDAQRERARLRRQKQRARGGPNAALAAHHIKQAVHIESKIDVKAHVTGKSVFTAPSKFRDAHLKSSTSSAEAPTKLHPDVSTMVRDLVEQQGALYVAADDRGVIMTDSKGRIYCVKPPTSQDPSFLDAQRHTGQELKRLQEQLDIRHGDNTASTNTRGNFAKVQVGTSFGGGQKQPTRFSTDIGGEGRRNKREEANRRHLYTFLKDKKVRRVVKHMQTCADNAFPEIMEEYRQLNDDLKLNEAFRLYGDDDEDDDDFNYYFAAMTFNLGPQVTTIFHRDAMNLQQGICCIQAHGRYNRQTSGHFIMKEPNVVVEFGPGDIIFVMSALITHGNAPLKPHEHRASWTFYTAGGLFRWRAAGERCLNTLRTEEEKQTYLDAAKSWSDLAWANLLTIDELIQYFKRLA